MIKLCHINALTEGSAEEFNLPDGRRVFVVHSGDKFYCYSNNCPHANLPLNMTPNDFLDLDKRYIRCVNHMALFEIATGNCVSGPCVGMGLQKEVLVVEDKMLCIEALK